MTPMVTGKNFKMASEFAELVQEFIKQHSDDSTSFRNALPEELKRLTFTKALSVNNTNENTSSNSSNIGGNVNQNTNNQTNQTWIPERAGEELSLNSNNSNQSISSGNSNSISSGNSNSDNSNPNRFKVGIKWDKNKNTLRQGNVNYDYGNLN